MRLHGPIEALNPKFTQMQTCILRYDYMNYMYSSRRKDRKYFTLQLFY